MLNYRIDHLKELESEAIYVIREIGHNLKIQLFFFGGKDSILLTHLAKAYYPAKIPFPLLHVDTGHNFLRQLNLETIWQKTQVKLIVGLVQESIDKGL